MALQRVFEFTADVRGRGDFRLAYEAFRGRNPEKIAKEERRSAAELQEALESVSTPIGDLPEDAELDVRFRRLNEERGLTLVVITHERNIAECASRIVELRDGKVESDGPVAPS